jgi:predicted metal-dependent hydrolase
MRNEIILRTKLENIWGSHFSDVSRINPIHIKFGRRARKRLGSIRECLHVSKRQNETMILINGHFKDRKIPDYIIDATIAHELCHYVQGFGSSMPKRTKFPHRGGVVNHEIDKRGLSDLVKKEKTWLDQNWHVYLDQETGSSTSSTD